MNTALNPDVAAARSSAPSAGPVARYAPATARVLLGLVFFVFGLNYFVPFFPPPKDPMPEGLVAFSGALMKTGYMLPLLKGTEVLVGALFLANRFVPLALAVLAPVIVNIVAVHAFLAPSGLPVALVVLALELYLAWAHRAAFRPMLQARGA
jgi:hypothetical protein